MNKKGEIVIVDDDTDDCEIFSDAIQRLKLPNKVICFHTVKDALDYLRKIDSDPFLIFSDLRMPLINGFEFRQMMYADENLIKKAIPFILFSLNISSADFNTALAVGVQGFFVKPLSMQELEHIITVTVNYFQIGFGN